MKVFTKKVLTGGGILLASLMFSNLLNFIFNAYLGRVLSFEDFGLVTLINTLWYFATIFLGALGITITHRIAYIGATSGKEKAAGFFMSTKKKSFFIAFGICFFWLISTPFVSHFFDTNNIIPLILFTPVILFGTLVSANRGFLQGNFYFIFLALITIIESLVKLLSTLVIVSLGFNFWAYASIPISVTCAFIISQLIISKKIKKIEKHNYRMPLRFYVAAVLTGIATTAFLSIDVFLVKHFLDPKGAGEYALLSLVGKMIYFFSSLLNIFIVPFASRDEGLKNNPNKNFYTILFASTVLCLIAYIPIGLFGNITVPILFGTKAFVIVPYLALYGGAIALYSVSSKIIVFHLSRHHYTFPIISFIFTFIMALGVIIYHQNIGEITNVVFITSLASFTVTILLHFIQINEKFLLSNIVDFFYLFKGLPKVSPVLKIDDTHKRILILNWRDTKHRFAGGAEVYIHELAKRWVRKGHQVTLFCGNDGKSARNEAIDGVQVIRRGGFYFVYVWAFIYYITKFRGKYDVIIDSQNGVPFFTPFYAKEPVYSVLYHVHQDVFYKSLPKPLAFVASTLENLFMPWAYKKTKFITISNSTREEMKTINLTSNTVEIIYPGVDLKKLKPGDKSKTPMVLYMGRLKSYKSVNILIKSFRKILHVIPNAKLVIAGEGEEFLNLRALAQKLGIIEKIEFTGKINEEDKVNLLQRAWVFVNPSFMEGWGITTIEANACGTPVVASDVPGLKDSVRNPSTGFLVEYGDSDAFAERILTLLKNKDLRSKMSKLSVEWAKTHDWESSANKGLEVLNIKI